MKTKEITVELAHSNGPIFFISDIHANYPALKAVLSDIPLNAKIYCAGDITGYYDGSGDVCDLLMMRNVECIQGNHDKYVLGSLSYPHDREHKYRINLSRSCLSSRQFEWLATLPEMLKIEFTAINHANVRYNKTIHVAHGSPWNVEQYVYPDTPLDFIAQYQSDFLILGHTHHPMHRQIGRTQVVNPGSVGQPRDRIPGACYASIDVMSNQVNLNRVYYDYISYQRELKNSNLDMDMIDILSRKK